MTLNKEFQSQKIQEKNILIEIDHDLFMPLKGEIIEVNDKLESEPELVNNDPYGEGWMVKIKFDDLTQLEELLDLEAYEAITK